MNVYAARRQQLMERIGPRAVAIIGGKRLSVRNSDVEHRFRQSSDLWYLTGFTEPEALAVIAPGRAEKFTLFVRPRDPERETWTGRRAGVEDRVSTIDLRVDYLAPGAPETLLAEATIVRVGNRVGVVDVRCWQPSQPGRTVATGKAVYNIKRKEDTP